MRRNFDLGTPKEWIGQNVDLETGANEDHEMEKDKCDALSAQMMGKEEWVPLHLLEK